MNRSAAIVLVVGLLTIQGSVAGILVGNAGNAATTDDASTTEAESTSSAVQANGTGEAASANAATESTANGTTTESTTGGAGTPNGTEPTTAGTTSKETTTGEPTESSSPTDTAETTAGSETTTRSRQSPPTATEGSTPPSSLSSSPSSPAGTAGPAPSSGTAPSGASAGAGSGATPSATAGSGAPPGAASGSSPSAPSGASPSGPSAPSGGVASGSAPSGAQPTPATAPAGASSAQAPGGSASATTGSGAQTASPDAEFEVVSVSSAVPVGGTGTVSVTIENTGEDATDAVVNLQSLSGDLLFGQSPNTSRFVGDWDEGERRTIEVTMGAAPTADTDEYPVRTTVSYDDPDGDSAQSAPFTFGVTPDDEQGFSLDGVDGDFDAGEKGTISGTITNDGPEAATDAVLAFSPNGSRDVVPRQSQYVLGDLDSGVSASFELPVFVNSTAEPGERQVPLVVQYYDAEGNPMQSETLNARVEIGAEREDFEIVDVESDVEAGEEGTLSVTVNNTGENVTDAVISFQSLSGGLLFGQSPNATQFVEEWNTGERRTFEFDVTAADSNAEQNYPMQASLTYDDSDGDAAQSGPFTFGVTPDEQQDDFAVVSTTASVPVGDEGPVSVTLENTGADATEATVSLQSLSGDILFGQAPNATQFVGEWPAGAQRTVTFNATASNRTTTQSYPVQASVSYNDADGDAAQSGPFTVGLTPQPEQTFSLNNTSSTLGVGEEGTVSGTVTNGGPGVAQNAVVTLVSRNENVEPQATEVALGTLPADGSANFSLPVEVTDSAEAGRQQFSFVVEYDNQNGDPRRSGTLDAQFAVGPQRDEFRVRPNESTLDVGSSDTVTLVVTNNRDVVVRNINAKAFVDDPLSISSDEAYIARLKPNESKEIAFDVSANGGASEGQYPLSVDFEYDTADGESALSETYDVPVRVAASEGGGILSSLSLMVGLGLLLVLFGVGWVYSRR